MSKKKKFNRFSKKNCWANKRVTPKGYGMVSWPKGTKN